jgi:hypothetical protein
LVILRPTIPLMPLILFTRIIDYLENVVSVPSGTNRGFYALYATALT